MRAPVRAARVCLVALLAFLLASAALLFVRARASQQVETTTYTALGGEAEWRGDWTITPEGADPSEAGSLAGTDRVSIRFTGTGLDLWVRRGAYRAWLWVWVDDKPANLLPQTERGPYLTLTAPGYDLAVERATIAVARGLDEGRHVVELVADRGWSQFPLVGWTVRTGPNTEAYGSALRAAAAGAAVCFTGLVGFSLRRGTRSREGAGDLAGVAVPAQLAPNLRFLSNALSSPASVLLTAVVFYGSPWLPLTLASGAALFAQILHRLDLGLALVALSAPFYLHPRPLFGKSFSTAEIMILLCAAAWGVRQLRQWHTILRGQWSLSTADWAVLLLVVAATASTLFADQRHVALRELRVSIVEPALFYLMIRTTELNEGGRWRIIDGFVAGAAVVSLIGLAQYALDINVITAESGVRRLRSVYGSPNNAALYMGRVLPLLLAVAAFARHLRRQIVYGLIALLIVVATLLTFSRASILLGIPLSLIALGLLAGGRWRWVALALLLGAALGVVPLLGTPRFRGLFDPQGGTLFFRMQLWRSSWSMFKDHPWLGVGPDNFLYAYRGRYMLPQAWQEPHLSHAHNILLTYATRLGVLGLIAGIWLYASFWCSGLRVLTNQGLDRCAPVLGLMGSVAYGIGHGLVDASAFFPDLAIAFLLALSLVQSAWRCKSYEQEHKH